MDEQSCNNFSPTKELNPSSHSDSPSSSNSLPNSSRNPPILPIPAILLLTIGISRFRSLEKSRSLCCIPSIELATNLVGALASALVSGLDLCNSGSREIDLWCFDRSGFFPTSPPLHQIPETTRRHEPRHQAHHRRDVQEVRCAGG